MESTEAFFINIEKKPRFSLKLNMGQSVLILYVSMLLSANHCICIYHMGDNVPVTSGWFIYKQVKTLLLNSEKVAL